MPLPHRVRALVCGRRRAKELEQADGAQQGGGQLELLDELLACHLPRLSLLPACGARRRVCRVARLATAVPMVTRVAQPHLRRLALDVLFVGLNLIRLGWG